MYNENEGRKGKLMKKGAIGAGNFERIGAPEDTRDSVKERTLPEAMA